MHPVPCPVSFRVFYVLLSLFLLHYMNGKNKVMMMMMMKILTPLLAILHLYISGINAHISCVGADH